MARPKPPAFAVEDMGVKMIYGPNHDPEFMLQAALKGFAGAQDRFNADSAARVGAEDVFVPLLEALWWTVTVDD